MENSGFSDKLVSVANSGPHEHMEEDLASVEIAIWLVKNDIVKANQIDLRMDNFWSNTVNEHNETR